MHYYAVDVGRLVDLMHEKPVVVGWSMGGLVAQIIAGSGGAAAWVGLEPSPPAQKVDDALPLRTGVFDPTEYGIISSDPLAQPAMPDLDIEERKIALATLGPESRLTRDERKRGIVIDSVPCPTLVVVGTGPDGQARRGFGAQWLDSDALVVDGVSHWGLVLNRRVLGKLVDDVVGWLVVNGVGPAS
jgi:pimeloyl-ACP methyl ester carboxylesterase